MFRNVTRERVSNLDVIGKEVSKNSKVSEEEGDVRWVGQGQYCTLLQN